MKTVKAIHTLTIALLLGALFCGPVAADEQSYQSTLKAVASYQKSVERGDLQRTLAAQSEALEHWNRLTLQEKRRLETAAPGAMAWLQGGQDYENSNYNRGRFARRR